MGEPGVHRTRTADIPGDVLCVQGVSQIHTLRAVWPAAHQSRRACNVSFSRGPDWEHTLPELPDSSLILIERRRKFEATAHRPYGKVQNARRVTASSGHFPFTRHPCNEECSRNNIADSGNRVGREPRTTFLISTTGASYWLPPKSSAHPAKSFDTTRKGISLPSAFALAASQFPTTQL